MKPGDELSACTGFRAVDVKRMIKEVCKFDSTQKILDFVQSAGKESAKEEKTVALMTMHKKHRRSIIEQKITRNRLLIDGFRLPRGCRIVQDVIKGSFPLDGDK
ncbi:hypothetical protein KIN20_021968 [Parelaphostrongylus tenuis]|uniref:Uncharacterized protein n=1 Tax=Parelaphostrongylus tenuis TaxID=148309 RepID=A0AAD5MPL1_PARTN|nr:hypothetical protein KIN20_021968 [Parelaphostrongylus tenuis]